MESKISIGHQTITTPSGATFLISSIDGVSVINPEPGKREIEFWKVVGLSALLAPIYLFFVVNMPGQDVISTDDPASVLFGLALLIGLILFFSSEKTMGKKGSIVIHGRMGNTTVLSTFDEEALSATKSDIEEALRLKVSSDATT